MKSYSPGYNFTNVYSRKLLIRYACLVVVFALSMALMGNILINPAYEDARKLIFTVWLVTSIILLTAVSLLLYFGILRPFLNLNSRLSSLYGNIKPAAGGFSDITPEEMLDEVTDYQQTVANRELTYEYLRAQAELNALQSQINPHFLFNTLESIRGFAQKQNVPEIADITEAMSSLFRNSIQKVDTLIHLRDEIENVRNYMLIQEFRFPGKFRLEMDLEGGEELLNCKLPNLTIQPLVENAIFHGLELIPSGGLINIEIYSTEKRLIIHVSDNGHGIPKERLAELNDRLASNDANGLKPDGKKGAGIGLANIHKRIKLQMGPQYGLAISSTLNIGTEIEVTLPLLKDR